MNGSQRLDCDAIAELHDTHLCRAKAADPELAASLAQCGNPAELALLDVACGSGQLIANYRTVAGARLGGIDHSLGMLRLARRKVRMIGRIRVDAALLPITDSGFNYISCQFAFHQFQDKSDMLGETSRLLRPGGRLVLHNLCPQGCRDWLYCRYFPEHGRLTGGISGQRTDQVRNGGRLRP